MYMSKKYCNVKYTTVSSVYVHLIVQHVQRTQFIMIVQFCIYLILEWTISKGGHYEFEAVNSYVVNAELILIIDCSTGQYPLGQFFSFVMISL